MTSILYYIINTKTKISKYSISATRIDRYTELGKLTGGNQWRIDGNFHWGGGYILYIVGTDLPYMGVNVIDV